MGAGLDPSNHPSFSLLGQAISPYPSSWAATLVRRSPPFVTWPATIVWPGGAQCQSVQVQVLSFYCGRDWGQRWGLKKKKKKNIYMYIEEFGYH